MLGFGANYKVVCLEAAANVFSNVRIVACVALLDRLSVVSDLELCNIRCH